MPSIKRPTNEEIASLRELLRAKEEIMQKHEHKLKIKHFKKPGKRGKDAKLLNAKSMLMRDIILAEGFYSQSIQIMQLLFNSGESAQNKVTNLLVEAIQVAILHTSIPEHNPYFLANAALIKYLLEDGYDLVLAIRELDYDDFLSPVKLRIILSAFLPSINVELANREIDLRRSMYGKFGCNLYCEISKEIPCFPVLYEGKRYDLLYLVTHDPDFVETIDTTQVMFDRAYAMRLRQAVTAKNTRNLLDLAVHILLVNHPAEILWLMLCILDFQLHGLYLARNDLIVALLKQKFSQDEFNFGCALIFYASMMMGLTCASVTMQFSRAGTVLLTTHNNWIRNLPIFNYAMASIYAALFLLDMHNVASQQLTPHAFSPTIWYGVCLLGYIICAEIAVLKTPARNLNGLGIIPPMHAKKCSLYKGPGPTARALTLSFNRLVIDGKVNDALAQQGIIETVTRYTTPKWR